MDQNSLYLHDLIFPDFQLKLDTRQMVQIHHYCNCTVIAADLISLELIPLYFYEESTTFHNFFFHIKPMFY